MDARGAILRPAAPPNGHAPDPEPAIGPYPQGPEFQERALGAALRDRGFYARNRRFYRPELFTAPHAADLARALAAYHQAHQAVPSLDLFPEVAADDALKRGLKPSVVAERRAAAARVASAAPGDDGWVRERMLEWVRSQTMAASAMRIADLHDRALRNGGPASHHAEFLRIMEDAVAACAGAEDAGWLDYFDDLVPRLFADHNALRTTTGYPPLDDALEGGIDRGELLQFLGLWNIGKTSILVGMARGCLMHCLRTLVITNQVKPRQWAARVDRAITGCTRAEILRDPKRYVRQIRRLQQAKGRLVIKGYPEGEATCADIDAVLVRLRDEEGFVPDRLIVDMPDEMAPTRHRDDFRLGQIEVVRGLRAIAQRWDISAAVVGQADAAAEGKEFVGAQNQSEAKGKNRIFDIVVSLSQTAEEAARQPAEMRLCCVRVRESGKFAPIPMIFEPSRGVIVPAASIAAARPDESVVRYGAPPSGNGRGR